MNDCEPVLCFAQQVYGYGKAGDVFLGISTSGNSKNILYAATTARAIGMKVIGLTGAKNSKLDQMCDVCIKVPQTETYKIQELHLPVYHCLCLMLENEFLRKEIKMRVVFISQAVLNKNNGGGQFVRSLSGLLRKAVGVDNVTVISLPDQNDTALYNRVEKNLIIYEDSPSKIQMAKMSYLDALNG